ncbi:ECF transporter S component [Sporosarcina thermotolerans]|uniref:ECF transporter S component n=1 Tax=Sporosarcina thermotolerans TaxID=633404 RepID=A0AAW9ACK5_9BACL|nr:ECF transporter S component [Sporosarcina thermotolerans]MDW0118764.1 ECF transporter S component [Sporosarcina thermotolerans]WHT48435.1 ECF transporter S component [Sporosarcina thermotolerans]
MQNIQPSAQSATRARTFDLVLTAILSTLVLISTMFINIKLPIGQGGLIHLGTGALFIVAILFGPKKGALAGAIGMGLFDIFGGWIIWAPTTIVARALQGYIVGKIAWSNGHRGDSVKLNILAAVASTPVMLAVYYIGQGIMYNNWVAPLASIPGDLIQSVVGLLIAIPLCLALKKTPFFRKNF